MFSLGVEQDDANYRTTQSKRLRGYRLLGVLASTPGFAILPVCFNVFQIFVEHARFENHRPLWREIIRFSGSKASNVRRVESFIFRV